jgi:hypothetical protein
MADFQIDPNDPGFLTRFYRKMMGYPETYSGSENAVVTPDNANAPTEGRVFSNKDIKVSNPSKDFIAPSFGSNWPANPFRRAQTASMPEPQENPRLGPDSNMAPRTGMMPHVDQSVRLGPDQNMAPRTGMEPKQKIPTPPRRDEGMHKVWYDKNGHRVGIGDTPPPGVDPESFDMESNKMTGFQRFMRGAYDVDDQGNSAFLAGAFNKKAEGGSIGHASRIAQEKSTPCHKGIIHMAVGGRTDHLPMNVLEGSYVLPADIVSGLGEGNTLAGGKILDQMFSGKQGPAGAAIPSFRSSPNFPALANKTPEDYMKYINQGRKAGQSMVGAQEKEQAQPNARGGTIASHNRRPVPIIAAGGEYVIDPDDVMGYGEGDLDRGHEKLDQFVKFVRANTVKTLRKLPGPRKD